MALKVPRMEIEKRVLPSFRGWNRKFSSFLRFQKYRSDEVSVSAVIVALDGSGDYDDIQAAIDSLPDTGGHVHAKAGIYTITAALLISKNNVSLSGDGKSTKIQTTSDVRLINISSASNCTIKNIYLYGSGSGKSSNNGIFISSSNNTLIERCILENCGNTAIETSSSTDIRIESCSLNSNIGVAILIGSDSNFAKVINNDLASNGNSSIEGSRCDNLFISNNKCDSATQNHGINLYTVNFACIENNQCNNNLASGIQLTDCSNCVVTGNVAESNGSGDSGIVLNTVLIECNFNSIVANTCKSNGTGITINDSSCNLNTVTNNILQGNITATIADNGTATQIGHNITDRPIS